MNRSSRQLAISFGLLLVVGLSALPTSTAAGSGDASAAEVASGLKKIREIAANTAEAAGKDITRAEELIEGIEPVWEEIEGTLKSNDKDAYVQLEDNFTLLKIGAKAGDADKASQASDKVAAAVTGYLGQHPAPAGAANATDAAPPETRSAAAAADTPGAPLPRTGPPSVMVLTAMAGLALTTGGLATMGGAVSRRRRAAPPA